MDPLLDQSRAPTITSINPTSATAGGPAFTLTVNGTNFVTGAVVRWNTTALMTTLVSPSQLTATVPETLIASAGSATITVLSGSVTSSGLPFTINPPAPTITSINRTSATAGGPAFMLTVNGTNFVAGAVVRWNTTALTTTFSSASQLTAALPATSISARGARDHGAFGKCNDQWIAVHDLSTAPRDCFTHPSSATAGGAAFTLTVGGSIFVTGAAVQWNATDSRQRWAAQHN